MRAPLPLALPLAVLVLAAASTTASARSTQDHVQFGQDITISEDETASDVVCAFCSVHVHGKVMGDTVVFLGNVTVDDNQSVSGDVVVFGGDLKLGEESTVGGDAVIFAGDAYAPDGTIHGDRVTMPGRLWILIPFAPFLLVAGIIWLIVYFVQRNAYRFPAYPQGRGIPPRA